MKKFKFRLQAVLDFRERSCEQLKGELLKANQLLTESEQEVSRLENIYSQNIFNNQEVRPVAEVLLNAHTNQSLNLKIEQAKLIVEQKQQAVDQALELFQEASKELKSVSVLKERKLQEFDKKLAEHESSSLDELAVQRAAKKGFDDQQLN